MVEGMYAESLPRLHPHRLRRLCDNILSVKESVMEMFPVMVIAGVCLLISVVVGIYGVYKYN